MRLFAAVWPPPGVMGLLAAFERPDVPGLRWTTPDQWHVTVKFFGEAAPEDIGPMPRPEGAVATMGPATTRVGRHVLAVPVAGLEGIAAAFPQERPFRGHLTLARSRSGPVPASLVGRPIGASWPVDRVTLVRSELGRSGARYVVLRGA